MSDQNTEFAEAGEDKQLSFRWKLTLAKVSLSAMSIVLALAVCEGVLRWQDRIGPIHKLSGFEANRELSYSFHHYNGDEAIDVSRVPPSIDESSMLLKILFLGDSWMANGGIPKGFAEYYQSRLPADLQLELINGGISSYSPSLIMLQGEYLIARHEPDLVLVYIDETDLMDETLRYRQTSAFNAGGRLLAVAPPVTELVLPAGFMALEDQPSYILRAIEKAYFTRVFMPRLERVIRSQGFAQEASDGNLFGPQLSLEPYETHDDEIDYFRGKVSEMLDRLITAVPTGRVLLTHHPHFLHLQEENGSKYNDVVSEILTEAAASQKVPFYEACDDVNTIYGDRYAEFFQWPEDKASHLTDPGYRRYGWRLRRTSTVK